MTTELRGSEKLKMTCDSSVAELDAEALAQISGGAFVLWGDSFPLGTPRDWLISADRYFTRDLDISKTLDISRGF